jgi:hypothetical protein
MGIHPATPADAVKQRHREGCSRGETDGFEEERTEGFFKYTIAVTISWCQPLKSIKRIVKDVGTADVTIQEE